MDNVQMSKQGKQILLRNEILEGGLDPQCFMDYMGTVKSEGQNIELDNWTMKQLKQVVYDFKQQIKTDTDVLQKVKQSQMRDSHEMMNKIIKSVIKKQKVFYERGVWDYEIINQQQCKTIPKPFQFNPKIKPKIHILNWQVRSHGGFFLGIGATKQLWLKIETNFTQKIIQRNNSDVQWYRNALLKFHPGAFIPPLEQLRAIQPQDKGGLAHRSKMIRQFLNSLLQYEHLIQSQISKAFFTQFDHNKFTNCKNKQRSVGLSKNVGRIQTLQGKFQLQISQRSQKYIKNSSLFGKVTHQTYSQVQIQINKVLSDMQTLSKHVFYLSNSCGILHQKYTKICGLNDIKESSMGTIMIYLNNMFSNVGKNIKEQMGVVKQFWDQFIQFSIRSWEEFQLHDKRYQRQVQNYLTFKSQLIRKKQRFINDVSKWELDSQKQFQKISRMNTAVMQKDQVFALMFPRDNKTEEELRIWVAYLNKVYQDSFKELLKEQENRLKQKFTLYVQHTAKLNNQNYSAAKDFKEMVAASS